ncbi:MAG: hypothetical protein AAGK78_09820, partial [Planctomycetota bacterium]
DSAFSQTTFSRPFVSPDGTLVGFRGDLEQSGTFFDDAIVVAPIASPQSGFAIQEGFAIGPDLSVAFDQHVNVTNAGTIAFTGRSRSGTLTNPGDLFFTFDGATTAVLAETGTTVNEGTLAANSINSAYLAATGAIGYQAFLEQASVDEQARVLFGGATLAAAGNTPAGAPAATAVFEFETTHFGNNGQSFLTQARSFPPNRTVDTLIVNGDVELVGGQAIPGSTLTSPLVDTGPSYAAMNEAGMWFARGSLVDGTEYALVDGLVFAQDGDAISAGSSETWAEFDGISVDNLGNVVVLGVSSTGEQVVVLNGEDELVREGDAVDLDGNGLFDDDLFIRDFSIDDLVLSTAGELVFAARLEDGSGAASGHALLAVTVPEPAVGGLAVVGAAGLLFRRRR